MGNKSRRKKKMSKRELRKLKMRISSSTPRFRGAFAKKCTDGQMKNRNLKDANIGQPGTSAELLCNEESNNEHVAAAEGQPETSLLSAMQQFGCDVQCVPPFRSDQITLRQDICVEPPLLLAAPFVANISVNSTAQDEPLETIVFEITENPVHGDPLQNTPAPIKSDETSPPVSHPVKPKIKRPKKPPPKPASKPKTRLQYQEKMERYRKAAKKRREVANLRKTVQSPKTALLTDDSQVYANLLAIKLRAYSEETRHLVQQEINSIIEVADKGYLQLTRYSLLTSLHRGAREASVLEYTSVEDEDLNLTEVDNDDNLEFLDIKTE